MGELPTQGHETSVGNANPGQSAVMSDVEAGRLAVAGDGDIDWFSNSETGNRADTADTAEWSGMREEEYLSMTNDEGEVQLEPGSKIGFLTSAELHVGPGTSMKGDVTACDSLVVQGLLEGTIDADAMQISGSGKVDGTANLQTAEIEGEFTGTLTVKGLLTVRGAGKVHGTVRYGELELERGCQVSGDIARQDRAGAGDGGGVKRSIRKVKIAE